MYGGSRVSNVISVRQQFRRVLSTDPKDAIPAVLFSLMVATIVFIGEPPYALAKEPDLEKTAQTERHCPDNLPCQTMKNRS